MPLDLPPEGQGAQRLPAGSPPTLSPGLQWGQQPRSLWAPLWPCPGLLCCRGTPAPPLGPASTPAPGVLRGTCRVTEPRGRLSLRGCARRTSAQVMAWRRIGDRGSLRLFALNTSTPLHQRCTDRRVYVCTILQGVSWENPSAWADLAFSAPPAGQGPLVMVHRPARMPCGAAPALPLSGPCTPGPRQGSPYDLSPRGHPLLRAKSGQECPLSVRGAGRAVCGTRRPLQTLAPSPAPWHPVKGGLVTREQTLWTTQARVSNEFSQVPIRPVGEKEKRESARQPTDQTKKKNYTSKRPS